MMTKRLRIHGRVQGVGYRYALVEEAERLGVTGWVRNRRDGSVEALVHGAAKEVEELIAWTRRGPPAARVDEVRIEPAEEQAPARFELRPTA